LIGLRTTESEEKRMARHPMDAESQSLITEPSSDTATETADLRSGTWVERVRDYLFNDMLWDVVVSGTNADDWANLLSAIRSAAESHADVISKVEVIDKYEPMEEFPRETIRVRLFGVDAHVRSFTDDEIEIDFQPNLLLSENALAVLFMMRLLGDSTGRLTRLASEGVHDVAALTYSPTTKTYKMQI